MIVTDTSAIVELLLGGSRGEAVARALESDPGPVLAPALLDAEVTQAIRRLTLAEVISEARGRASVELLQEMPVRRMASTPVLPRMWQLRHALTAYDAAYVALAEATGCPLLTFDARIATAGDHAARVVLPG